MIPGLIVQCVTTAPLFCFKQTGISSLMQPNPGFQGVTHVLGVPIFHISRQIPYLENPVSIIEILRNETERSEQTV